LTPILFLTIKYTHYIHEITLNVNDTGKFGFSVQSDEDATYPYIVETTCKLLNEGDIIYSVDGLNCYGLSTDIIERIIMGHPKITLVIGTNVTDIFRPYIGPTHVVNIN